jgi:hypothetical protein
VLWKKQGEVIGDEPGNTDKDPDASEKAVSESEGRAGLPYLGTESRGLQTNYSDE